MTNSELKQYQWEPQAAAQSLVRRLTDAFLAACPDANALARRLYEHSGTRFIDWLDFIEMPADASLRQEAVDAGYRKVDEFERTDVYRNEGGIVPALLFTEHATRRFGIKVERVSDFTAAWQVSNASRIEGEPFAPLRWVKCFTGENAELWAVERHGSNGFRIEPFDATETTKSMRIEETFRRRERDFDDDFEGFAHTQRLVDASIREIGVDRTCDLFFAAERDYWMRRNGAAQVQHRRQSALGLGWGNHDHHTYRSSRHCYTQLIALFESMGFHGRERFYAGNEAGWGAQVLEQPNTNIVIFADVDLSPEEITGDFGREPLKERAELGTVGLWCALHGEAALQAGMHHLECMFDHDALREQLKQEGIGTMAPFTNFPFLRQAFTEGERWNIAEKRIQRLLDANRITAEQAEKFRTKGAIGSHLENLERNDGYKGFNQTGVSDIISRTDPRRMNEAAATM